MSATRTGSSLGDRMETDEESDAPSVKYKGVKRGAIEKEKKAINMQKGMMH